MYDVGRLPKWAQERIESMERERDTAVNALNAYTEHQTESPFYFDDFLCIGEDGAGRGPTFKRVYINGTNEMTVLFKGVELTIILSPNDKGMSISWNNADYMSGHVAMVPKSFQQVELIAKENMR